MNSCRILFVYALLSLLNRPLSAQKVSGSASDNTQFTEKMVDQLGDKASSVNEDIDKRTSRYLKRLAKKEQKLKRQLFKVDSLTAKDVFGNIQDKYSTLANKMTAVPKEKINRLQGKYIAGLDSLQGSLNFLGNNKELLGSSKATLDKLEGSLGQVNQLQGRLAQSEQVEAFLKERKKLIGEALAKYTGLPRGLTNTYKGYSKEAYYYSAQMKEYKAALNDPQKMQQKALELLNKLPAFQSFMQQHSILAGLFSVPANYGAPEALAGLQTRTQVQQLIGSRIASGGANAAGMVQQQLQSAQGQLTQLKNKLNELGGGSSADGDLPDFKPNTQKTKTFLNRLEYGSNLQTAKGNNFFPTTSDIGLHVGYKINDKSVIGIGGSYKLGLGKDIRHVAFSHQGVGVRSYVDYKIKGSFWLSGGAEMNYRSQFDNFQALKDHSAWQQSALIGFSKKYQVSKKVKGNAQLLYDALWKQQVPRGQAVVFRVGYNLK